MDSLIPQHQLRTIQQIGLKRNSVRAFPSQGLGDIAVYLLLIETVQRGKLVIVIIQDLCHAAGVMNGIILRCAESVVLRALVHGVKTGNGFVPIVHQACTHHESCQIGHLPGAVLLLRQPGGVRIGGGRIDLPCGNHRVQRVRDVPENRVIVAAGTQTRQCQFVPFRVLQAEAVQVIHKGFRFQFLQTSLEIRHTSAIGAAHICQVDPPPGIGDVRVFNVRDGAISLRGIDVVRIGAAVGAVRIQRYAQCAGLIQIGIVFRHIPCRAESRAHLPAAGGTDGNDSVLVAGDHVAVGPQGDNAGLQIHHLGRRFAGMQSILVHRVPAAGTGGHIHHACRDIARVYRPGRGRTPAATFVQIDDGSGIRRITAHDSLMIDSGDISFLIRQHIRGRHIHQHSLVFQIGDIGVHVYALIDGAAHVPESAHAAASAEAALATSAKATLLTALILRKTAIRHFTLVLREAAVGRVTTRKTALRHPASEAILPQINAFFIICADVDGGFLTGRCLTAFVHSCQGIIGSVLAENPFVHACFYARRVIQIDGRVNGGVLHRSRSFRYIHRCAFLRLRHARQAHQHHHRKCPTDQTFHRQSSSFCYLLCAYSQSRTASIR